MTYYSSKHQALASTTHPHHKRHLPTKPLIFSLEHHLKTNLSPQPVFSLENLKMDKVRQQQRLLETAKCPSFNIKKIG